MDIKCFSATPVIFILIFAVWLTACTAPPTATEDRAHHPTLAFTDERDAAAGLALLSGRYADRLQQRCGNLSTANRRQADTAFAAWEQRNAALLETASRYFQLAREHIRHESGEEDAQIFYENQLAFFEKLANDQVIRTLGQEPPSVEICQTALDNLANGLDDLENQIPDAWETIKAIEADLRSDN